MGLKGGAKTEFLRRVTSSFPNAGPGMSVWLLEILTLRFESHYNSQIILVW